MLRRKDFSSFVNAFIFLKLVDIENAANTYIRTNQIDNKSIIGKLFSKCQSASVKVQGSKASLFDRRMDMKSYIIFFGLPLFYLTINPADVHNPLLLFIAGEKITLTSLTIKSTFLRM